MIFLWIFLGLAAAVLGISYLCFRMAFYISDKEKQANAARPLPPGEEYQPYRPAMTAWQQQVKEFPFEKVSITSFDGLKLVGKYYERFPGAPIELMMHGYRGNANRDLCGGVQRCFACGRNALLIDQRASGESGGNIISFGINEHRDCLSWVAFMRQHFGEDVKIILTGISMGAATVLIAAGEALPDNVIGVLADCGYTSAKDIICKVIAGMKLPAGLAYPFVKLGARLFGGFCLDETAPIDAVKRAKIPVIFFHGESDDFVPCDMSRNMYDACASRKHLHTVPGAGHGLAFPADEETYLTVLKEFFQ